MSKAGSKAIRVVDGWTRSVLSSLTAAGRWIRGATASTFSIVERFACRRS